MWRVVCGVCHVWQLRHCPYTAHGVPAVCHSRSTGPCASILVALIAAHAAIIVTGGRQWAQACLASAGAAVRKATAVQQKQQRSGAFHSAAASLRLLESLSKAAAHIHQATRALSATVDEASDGAGTASTT